jgi:predicted ferric reductase
MEPNSKSFIEPPPASPFKTAIAVLVGLFVMLAAFAGGAFLAAIFQVTPVGQQSSNFLQWLVIPDPAHVTWYLTRGAGFTAYLLLWLSTAWGVAIPSRILEGKLHGAFTFEFHQFISLLSLVFTGLHIVVLLYDTYSPFSLAQILFPFISDYRPLWIGVGIISFYLMLVVTITFYMRNRIGSRSFRAIHLLSYLGFFGSALHSLLSGSDSSIPAVKLLYAGTVLSVVFLTFYWLIGLVMKKRTAQRPAVAGR